MKKQPYEMIYDDHILTTKSEIKALKCLSTGAIGLDYCGNLPIHLPHTMEGIYDHIKFGRLYWDDMKSNEFFTDSQRSYLQKIFTPKEVDFETALSLLIPKNRLITKNVFSERVYPTFDQFIGLGFFDDSCRMKHSVNFSAEITKGIRKIFDVTEFFKNDHLSATIKRGEITYKVVWKSKFSGQPIADLKGFNRSDYGFTLYKDWGDGKFKEILHFNLNNVRKLPPFDIGYCLGIALETLYNGYYENKCNDFHHPINYKEDYIMVNGIIWLKRDKNKKDNPINGYIIDNCPTLFKINHSW